jgi:hypothetical protein
MSSTFEIIDLSSGFNSFSFTLMIKAEKVDKPAVENASERSERKQDIEEDNQCIEMRESDDWVISDDIEAKSDEESVEHAVEYLPQWNVWVISLDRCVRIDLGNVGQ